MATKAKLGRSLRKSGLQLQVLTLYRDVLRAARALPIDSRISAISFIRHEFRHNSTHVDTLDIQRIEFLIRQAKKKLKQYSDPRVTGFSFINNTDKNTFINSSSTFLIAGKMKQDK